MENLDTSSISELSLTQKLGLLESVWSELSKEDKNLNSPDWHKNILKEREISLESNQAKFSNWNDAKERIKRNVSI